MDARSTDASISGDLLRAIQSQPEAPTFVNSISSFVTSSPTGGSDRSRRAASPTRYSPPPARAGSSSPTGTGSPRVVGSPRSVSSQSPTLKSPSPRSARKPRSATTDLELQLMPMVPSASGGLPYRIMLEAGGPRSAQTQYRSSDSGVSPRIERIRGEPLQQTWSPPKERTLRSLSEAVNLETGERRDPRKPPGHTVIVTESEMRKIEPKKETVFVHSTRDEVDRKMRSTSLAQQRSPSELSAFGGWSPRRAAASSSSVTASERQQLWESDPHVVSRSTASRAHIPGNDLDFKIGEAKEAAAVTDARLFAMRLTLRSDSATAAGSAPSGPAAVGQSGRASPVARGLESAKTRLAADREARSAGFGRLAYSTSEAASATYIDGVNRRLSASGAAAGAHAGSGSGGGGGGGGSFASSSGGGRPQPSERSSKRVEEREQWKVDGSYADRQAPKQESATSPRMLVVPRAKQALSVSDAGRGL